MMITTRLGLFLLVLLGTSWISRTASATTFNVTSTADEERAGNGCTLREALRAANDNLRNTDCASAAGGTDDVIRLDAGKTYSISGTPLVVTGVVTIKSKTTNKLATIRGRAGDPTLIVGGSNIDVHLEDLSLTHGSPAANSPGLVVGPATFVFLRRVVAKNNSVGIFVLDGGTLDLLNVSLHDNDHGSDDGGGILTGGHDSILHIEKSSIYRNKARRGAGIFSAGNLEIRDSTLALNVASLGGGGIYSSITAIQIDLKGVTITRNTSMTNSGAGVTRAGDHGVLWEYSIVAGNRGAAGDSGYDCVNITPDAEAKGSIYGFTCDPWGDSTFVTSDPELASGATEKYPERIGFKPESDEALPVNRGGWVIDNETDQFGKRRRFVDGDYEDGVDIGALERR